MKSYHARIFAYQNLTKDDNSTHFDDDAVSAVNCLSDIIISRNKRVRAS